MSDAVISSNNNSTCLGRVMTILESHAWEHWINNYTVWGYAEEERICNWAYAFVEHLEMDLHKRGFIFQYDTHGMARRILYWCWGIKCLMVSHDWPTIDLPFPRPCKENSNDQYEMELYNKAFTYRHWMDLESYWTPDFMNDEFAVQFFSNLGVFCWRHVTTERSPAIQKERDILAAEDEDGSTDDMRSNDQGSYFKGKKEFY